MPQYILETRGRVTLGEKPGAGRMSFEPITWPDLDAFTQGYIEALFFTCEAPGVDRETFESADHQEAMAAGAADGCLPGDAGFDDLSPGALAAIMRDCAAFKAKAADLLQVAYDCPAPDQPGFDELRTCPDYDETQAGRDFWFTRNGHGVGFWDRGLGQVGADLTALCGWRTDFPESDPYWQAGKVHV